MFKKNAEWCFYQKKYTFFQIEQSHQSSSKSSLINVYIQMTTVFIPKLESRSRLLQLMLWCARVSGLASDSISDVAKTSVVESLEKHDCKSNSGAKTQLSSLRWSSLDPGCALQNWQSSQGWPGNAKTQCSAADFHLKSLVFEGWLRKWAVWLQSLVQTTCHDFVWGRKVLHRRHGEQQWHLCQ